MPLDNIGVWVCSGCGEEFLDRRDWQRHVETCDKHYHALRIKALEAENAKLRAAATEAIATVNRLQALGGNDIPITLFRMRGLFEDAMEGGDDIGG